MPNIQKGESQKDFVSRAIPVLLKEGTAKNQEQATAIAYSMWREKNNVKIYRNSKLKRKDK
jgi:hypothetical protein